ncbi:hypothetical protein NDU88_003648 [Pleurodeles waltl]|uniref:Uncharacterized protein n=1 Tax=Pleurodeles waltl TaxID=8319 RepID=A0AAV7VGB0_PLEWA|nr:hypothetical protein NDU88_003648 [Pleurodeles waltl]
MEPSPAPPAGLTLPRPGLRAGRKCDSWCRLGTRSPRPREPPGRQHDRGSGCSAARTQCAKRARRPDHKRGPQRGSSRRRPPTAGQTFTRLSLRAGR